MAKNYFLFPLIACSFSIASFAQEEDPSCMAPPKKAQKFIDAGDNAKDAQEASMNYQKAVDAAPDNAGCYFAFGKYAYEAGMDYFETQPNPALGERSFQKAEVMLEKAVEYCDDYNTEMYYLLGVINYSQSEMDKAVMWFNKFVNFKSQDNSRYGADYAKQLSDVKEVLAELEAEKELMSTTVPFDPRMVPNVSSGEWDEYFPMISPDNEIMFFTRKVDRKSLGDTFSDWKEEFTFAKRKDEVSPFDKGTPFAKPFNDGSFDSYGAATMSVDNKEMIICACKMTKVGVEDYKNCDLYSTTFELNDQVKGGYQWTPLVNLGPKINTPDGWEGQPSLSADGQTLFFTANRRTTRDNDIFMVKRNPDGSWGAAESFEEINTDGKDKSPFLHQDSETLYFVSTSSDTRRGMGGLDIFYMREENGKWSKPKNIGNPINTTEDELGIFVSTDGKLAYFSSRANAGKWDIYGFELYEEARPKSVAILKGELKDPTGAPVVDATIEVAYANSDKVEQVKVNGNDGRYAVVVKTEEPQDIMVSVKKEGAAFDSKLITKEEIVKKEERTNNNLAVKELKVGEAYTINDILYDYNSDELKERSKFILREFARYLKEHQEIAITIQGHTDSDGDDAKNLDLSDRRAKGVRNYLISLGVDESRLEAVGFGETKPKVANDTADNKAKNRRTDFLIRGM